MELSELVIRERVRDTVAAYTHSGDRLQLTALADCFTENGALEVKGRTAAVGKAAIVAMLTPNSDTASDTEPPKAEKFFIRHFVTNLRFDSIESDRVETSAYFTVFTPNGVDHWGRYRDVLVPSGDRWLFSSRLVSVDATVDNSWFGSR
ncbi:hypothetical protein A0W34_30170 (plasmid) [Rhodococcus sp. BH4]|uniref:nuclear transport factor 2 family protein n=1 Tax=Rhodococcus sp. BH4 TaxID=1807790 RepID=UPI0009C1FD36|nr:nuclear transport factor 2 family protein [Rhodococcus sp. BH4]ARE37791.1 hypothetical protein A0W34_30170 [Rhodococcus sp. BH4]